MTATRDFNASTVLVDEGEITVDELRAMLAADIDSVKRIALRYNGIQAELANAATLIGNGSVDHSHDDSEVRALGEQVATIARNTSQVVARMRDLLEELAAHMPPEDDDAAHDEEE